MKKTRTIKITEAQLREATGDSFSYIDTTDATKKFDGQTDNSAEGKKNGEENANPLIGDKYFDSRTNQMFPRRWYGNTQFTHPVASRDLYEEGVQIQPTNSGENQFSKNVASMGNGNGVETLSDGDNTNNLAVVPDAVDRRLNQLIQTMQQSKLNPKQVATVLDKFQESFPEVAKNSEHIKNLLQQQIEGDKGLKKFH